MSLPETGRTSDAGPGRPAAGSSGLAVEARGLTKWYGQALALAGVDLAVPSGTVYGLLGPNGAGKTTTVRILSTLLAPDAGRARVAGHDLLGKPGLVRRAIALAGQSATVDGDLTGRENLVFLGRLAGLSRRASRERAMTLLAGFGLEHAAARQARSYSGGMRRRLDLAASLIIPAEVYFLDEPTTGLDPVGRAQVHQTVRSLAAGGSTVLLTTQYLDEADRLAGRIAVINDGRVVAEGTPGELKAAAGAGILRVRLADPGRRPEAGLVLARMLGEASQDESDPALLTGRVPARTGPPASQQAVAAVAGLDRAGIAVSEFALGQPTLDEVFLALIGAAGRDPGEVASCRQHPVGRRWPTS